MLKKKFSLTLVLLASLLLSSSVASQNAASQMTTRAVTGISAAARLPLTLPNAEKSVKMIVFGDSGRGNREQYELGKVMEDYRASFAYDTALLTGDNIYGTDKAEDMKKKFEDPYRRLLDQGVKFYASLGNHDSMNQKNYALFNMNGKEYYRIKKDNVAIYAINSNYLDKRQLEWIATEMAADGTKWKIAFFHHPPYSSGGRHGSEEEVRMLLHPLFVKYGVDIVFTGHDHFYERIKPQDGITYFVAGAAGKIRKGDIKDRSPLTAAGFDSDLSFMLVEFVDDAMHYQVLSRTGKTVDSGVISRRD